MEELTQIVQVTTNVSGIALRLHLTNLHGKSELVFQKLEFSFDETFHVKHEITLHGTATIKIPAGSRVITDPLKVAVHTGQRLFFRLSSSEPQNYLDFANTYDTTLTNAGMIRKADKLPPACENHLRPVVAGFALSKSNFGRQPNLRRFYLLEIR